MDPHLKFTSLPDGFRGTEGSCSLEPQGLEASLMDLPGTEALNWTVPCRRK